MFSLRLVAGECLRTREGVEPGRSGVRRSEAIGGRAQQTGPRSVLLGRREAPEGSPAEDEGGEPSEDARQEHTRPTDRRRTVLPRGVEARKRENRDTEVNGGTERKITGMSHYRRPF